MRIPILSLLALTLVAGCGGGKKNSAPRTVFGGDRPTTLQIPAAYDGTTAMPLLMIVHGYSVNGAIQEAYLQAASLIDTKNVFILAPDGTTDQAGKRFWNATDACCNLYGSNIDDVAYLKGLLADVQHDYKIDPKRIFLWGHSNGAFMSQRMACEDSEEIAAIVSLAGAQWEDATKCQPTAKVSVLDIHGDADGTISYTGGSILSHAYPSEAVTMSRWQTMDACTTGLTDDPTMIDLDSTLPGAETTVARLGGCPGGIGAELWTMHGADHTPSWNPGIADTVWTWLAAHPKP